MSKKFKAKVKLDGSDIQYKFISVYCGVEVVYWCFPVYNGRNDWEFWAIDDQYVDKDKNGNPRRVCASLYHFIRGATLEDCRKQCTDEAHIVYLVMRGMTQQEAYNAVAESNKRGEEV